MYVSVPTHCPPLMALPRFDENRAMQRRSFVRLMLTTALFFFFSAVLLSPLCLGLDLDAPLSSLFFDDVYPHAAPLLQRPCGCLTLSACRLPFLRKTDLVLASYCFTPMHSSATLGLTLSLWINRAWWRCLTAALCRHCGTPFAATHALCLRGRIFSRISPSFVRPLTACATSEWRLPNDNRRCHRISSAKWMHTGCRLRARRLTLNSSR